MLKKVLFQKDKHMYVDFDYLKNSYESGHLKGAMVFARLFNLIEDDLFLTEDKSVYDLTYYDVYIEDWVLFMSFVRNGYIPNFYDVNKNIKDMNYCYDVCIKFGGVPEYEKYYYEYFNFREEEEYKYNPMKPQDDVKNQYTWRIITPYTALSSNESATIQISTEPALSFYCRKLIKDN